MEGLLTGITVLDLTRVVAGPYCGYILADMGARVIKIENPAGGDDTRSLPPFFDKERTRSAYFMNFNRGKEGITLNFKQPGAKEIFFELVKKADVVIENYRPGTMEKLGIGYDVLKEVNPAIIYGSVSGFGHTGPYSKRAGYDIIGQAAGGMMSVTGWPDGPATRVGAPIGDILGGLNLAIGLLAAIVKRDRTGQGEKVDIALTDAIVSAMQPMTVHYQTTGVVPQRIGNRYLSMYPYDSFPCSDGAVVIGAGNNKLFALICKVMGREDLPADPRYQTPSQRVDLWEELNKDVSAWTSQFTIDEVIEKLNAAGIPAAPVNTIDRMLKDEQIAGARGMFPEFEQPGIGKVAVTAIAPHMTNCPPAPQGPAPELGQHTAAVLEEFLGYGPEKLAELKEQNII